MFAHFLKPLRPLAILALLGGASVSGVAVTPACAADLAQDKAVVVAAKAAGTVGEQADGFLGFVNGSADAATTAAVTDINAGRAETYRQTAAKTGVTPEAAGEAVAHQLFNKMPAGQYYKPNGGGWTRK